MKENNSKTVLAIDLKDDDTASVTLGGNLDDIVYSLVNGVGIVISHLADTAPDDLKKDMFNDIKDLVIETVSSEINYDSYGDLDHYDLDEDNE